MKLLQIQRKQRDRKISDVNFELLTTKRHTGDIGATALVFFLFLTVFCTKRPTQILSI